MALRGIGRARGDGGLKAEGYLFAASFYTAILFTYTKDILNILATFGKILTKLRNSV